MRIVIEIPDEAGQAATVRQEASAVAAEPTTSLTEKSTEPVQAQDGGPPAQSLLAALGAEQRPDGGESRAPINEADNLDGGSVAPWLTDLISVAAQR